MLLEEAAGLNPGPWVEHNKTAGFCARAISEKCGDMNPDVAYVMGLLHDVGRREGIMDKMIAQKRKRSLYRIILIR